MKKLMTILGAVLFVGAVLTSCGGGPDACECGKNAMKAGTDAWDTDLQKECEDHANSLEGTEKAEWGKAVLECLSF